MSIARYLMVKKERRDGGTAPAALWHAVSIETHKVDCTAAVKCRGKRFLSREAPALPMPECSHPQLCECIYRHFADRRIKARRRNEIGGLAPASKVAYDQRTGNGRRQSDASNAAEPSQGIPAL